MGKKEGVGVCVQSQRVCQGIIIDDANNTAYRGGGGGGGRLT